MSAWLSARAQLCGSTPLWTLLRRREGHVLDVVNVTAVAAERGGRPSTTWVGLARSAEGLRERLRAPEEEGLLPADHCDVGSHGSGQPANWACKFLSCQHPTKARANS